MFLFDFFLGIRNLRLEEENCLFKRKNEDLLESLKNTILERDSLKELILMKEQEMEVKNQKFELFMKEFQRKFVSLKEQLEEEEKMRNIYLIEQKELLQKYKHVIEN